VVGLGNPGRSYEGTRHNVGACVAESLAKARRAAWTRTPLYRQVRLRGLTLCVPLSYVNRTGTAIAALLRETATPVARMLVVCDDVNLPLGRLRLRRRGGDGGHKGLRSVIAVLGTEEFARLRLGVGKPPVSGPLEDYVLDQFPSDQMPTVDAMVSRAAEAVVCWHGEGMEAAMARFNAPAEEGAA
jgi:PTH1 family peptidyl-tRNA hydrolase